MAVKRFYKSATVAPAENGHAILLDGKTLRTPAKNSLVLPTVELAAAIAAEWAAQGETVEPDTMRLMKLASTAIDHVAGVRAAVAVEAGKYAETDLLCYRAGEPADLVARQRQCWQPLLDWAVQEFDAPLVTGVGILPIAQPADSTRALRSALEGLDPFGLTAVADLTATLGSLVLALAILHGRIDAPAAVEAALLDEIFQMERWGEDREVLHRHRRLKSDVEAAGQFLNLLRG